MYVRRRQTNWWGITVGLLALFLLAGLVAIAVFEFFQIKQLRAEAEAARVQAGNAKTAAFELHLQKDAFVTQLAIAEQESPAQTQMRILKE